MEDKIEDNHKLKMYTLITTGKDLANEQKGKELKHK
jgi:hypothetical protein